VSGSQPGGGFGTVYHPEPDPAPGSNGGPVRIGQLRPLPRRRRPGMIFLAVALIGAGVLGGAALFQHVNHQVPVLMLIRDVPAGSPVTAADLDTTSVTTSPSVRVVPARQESQVIGLIAETDLPPGTLLAGSELTSSLPPAAGQVLVPVPVKPSGLPASGLVSGDHLLVVPAPGAQGGSASAAAGPALPVRPIPGVVEAVSQGPDQDGLEVVDLLVQSASGPALARETATGDFVLVVTSRSP
jgi:hypothetical protein